MCSTMTVVVCQRAIDMSMRTRAIIALLPVILLTAIWLPFTVMLYIGWFAQAVINILNNVAIITKEWVQNGS